MKSKLQLWFNDLNPLAQYHGDEPSFIAVENLEEVQAILKNLDVCYLELKDYLSRFDMDPYFNTSLVEKDKDWQTIGLIAWAMPLLKKQKYFPRTMKILKKNPNIITFSFNKLEPNSVIKPHCGDCNGTYRIHIGLDVPSGLPDCGFRVKEKKMEWQYGKAFGFIDAFEHEAWNHTNQPRYIILLDIIRPEFKGFRNYICFRVLMSLLLQKIVYLFPFMLKAPTWVKKGIFYGLKIPEKIMTLVKR
jgi:aspartyl/asparaginyl beta-hydroxylase (cupin superfamily)